MCIVTNGVNTAHEILYKPVVLFTGIYFSVLQIVVQNFTLYVVERT